MFSYRGGTEKIISISPASIETVGCDSFISWHVDGFWWAVLDGEVTHRPDGRRVRPPLAEARQITGAGFDMISADEFDALYQSLGASGRPRDDLLRWLHAVRTGSVPPLWMDVLGLFMIELGATRQGLGKTIARPTGRGRPSLRQAEARETQALIARFAAHLAGGEPILATEFRWLQQLVETAMSATGLMMPPPPAVIGRPVDRTSSARFIAQIREAGRLPAQRGSLAKAIQAAALDTVLRHRQVAAAWRGEEHQTITVMATDDAVRMEVERINESLRKIRRRARQCRS